MAYKFTFEDGSSAYLAHHGIKGMKWGVWNSETRARYEGTTKSGGVGGMAEEELDKARKELEALDDPEVRAKLEAGDVYGAAVLAAKKHPGDVGSGVTALAVSAANASGASEAIDNAAKGAAETAAEYDRYANASQSEIEKQREKNRSEKEERVRQIEETQQKAKEDGDPLWWLRGY